MERLAKQVRERLGLGQTDVLDPWGLADAVPAHILFPEDFGDPALAARLRAVNWDGGAFVFPEERMLIVILNPGRSRRRQCATLLEELSHHLLGHAPSRIYRDSATGLLRRNFDAAQEAEAYDFGSVLLLPKEHKSQFEPSGEKELAAFAEVLRLCLRKLDRALERAAYNYWLHTLPLREQPSAAYHWHLELKPTLSLPGGFE